MRSKSPVLMENIRSFSENFYLKNFKSPTKIQIANALNITPGTVSKYLAHMNNIGMVEYDGYTIHTHNTHKYSAPMCSAAILGSVSCGPLLFENENIEGYIALPETIFGKGEFYILKANGDSMIDAGIDDGDWVVIKKQNFANEGDIIVALVDGTNNLKYFYRDNRKNCAILRSANKNYDDILVNNLSIQGVATQIIKKV
ncbi:MAG: repressor LexA [Clostridiales bacterium]|nr:repressor LexA [Clostridiales bacterium]